MHPGWGGGGWDDSGENWGAAAAKTAGRRGVGGGGERCRRPPGEAPSLRCGAAPRADQVRGTATPPRSAGQPPASAGGAENGKDGWGVPPFFFFFSFSCFFSYFSLFHFRYFFLIFPLFLIFSLSLFLFSLFHYFSFFLKKILASIPLSPSLSLSLSDRLPCTTRSYDKKEPFLRGRSGTCQPAGRYGRAGQGGSLHNITGPECSLVLLPAAASAQCGQRGQPSSAGGLEAQERAAPCVLRGRCAWVFGRGGGKPNFL